MKKRKIRIQRVSSLNLVITIILAVLFIVVCVMGEKQFHVLQETTEKYITCENAAKQLQDGSDYLTEQVRLYAMTGEGKYRTLYFEEASKIKRREKARDALKVYFDGTETFEALQEALDCSRELMNTEYYSMRLVSEATEKDQRDWPEEIKNTQLSAEDKLLTNAEKIEKAQQIVCDDKYQDARTEITKDVSKCMNSLIIKTRNKQGRVTTIFSDMYLKLEIGIVVLIVLMLTMCIMVKHLIVTPLLSYNESITMGEIFPVIGAAELQNLAEIYNRVYLENQETQKLIRHQAEHDALTDALNRGSFEQILRIHEEGNSPIALLLIDVDVFKSVNDTYGHAMGDIVLKNVANLLKTAFRSVDYVCRIGGDEFAVIMVEMTSDLKYTIDDKMRFIREKLQNPEEGVPKVSLSVGVAFTDRENPGEDLFKDADKVLYQVKENGRDGWDFY